MDAVQNRERNRCKRGISKLGQYKRKTQVFHTVRQRGVNYQKLSRNWTTGMKAGAPIRILERSGGGMGTTHPNLQETLTTWGKGGVARMRHNKFKFCFHSVKAEKKKKN